MNSKTKNAIPVSLFPENYCFMDVFHSAKKDENIFFMLPISGNLKAGDTICVLEPHYRTGFWDVNSKEDIPDKNSWFFNQTAKNIEYANLLTRNDVDSFIKIGHSNIDKEAGLIVKTSFPASVMLINECRYFLEIESVCVRPFNEITDEESRLLGAPMAKRIGDLTFMNLPFEEMNFRDGLLDWFYVSFRDNVSRKSNVLLVSAKIIKNGK